MNSAAWAVRLSEEGMIRFYGAEALRQLFSGAGFAVARVELCFGTPRRAVVLLAEKTG